MTLLSASFRWHCPNCPDELMTYTVKPVMHVCKGLNGLVAPMVPFTVKANVRVVEREDYIGSDQVQLHEGRPVMAVTVERPDGQDVAVYAPSARGNGGI